MTRKNRKGPASAARPRAVAAGSGMADVQTYTAEPDTARIDAAPSFPVAYAMEGATIVHQPSPYGGTRTKSVEPPSRPNSLYHGDAETYVPVTIPGAEAANAPGRRATAVDALRGFFILSMTLGFTLQDEVFPVWMYHRQFPPPGHEFVDVAGISWRDVTYGAFLFSMAAAVPITLALRIKRGAVEFSILGAALRRFFMLFVFALLIGHSNTYFLGYTQTARMIAVVGFVITFLLFTRRRKDWNEARFDRMQRWAWVAAIVFLVASPLLYGKTFDINRRDDIIAALAFASVTGWTMWYFTRNNIPVRLGIFAIVTGLFLAARHPGAVQDFWFSSPLPFLFTNSSLVLLCVIIPGTIAGDMLLRWMQTPVTEKESRGNWSGGRTTALLLLALAATPVLVAGMYNRLVMETGIALAVIVGTAMVLSARPATPTERLVKQLIWWSAACLLVGMLLEPIDGGIRKVPDNLSYYVCMAGISMLLLTAATIIVELMNGKRAVQFLTDVGQNPMLGYIIYTVLLNSIFEMIPAMRGFMLGSPATSFVRSVLTVILVGFITREFTRRRIFWRA